MSKELYSSYNKKKKVLNKWCYLELQINTLQAFTLILFVTFNERRKS